MFQYIHALGLSWVYHAYVFITCTFFPPVPTNNRPHILSTDESITCTEYVYESYSAASDKPADVYYTWTSPSSDMAIGQIPETYVPQHESHFSHLRKITNIPIYVEYTAPDVDPIRFYPPSYLWTVNGALFSKAHVHSLLRHLDKLECWNPLYVLTIMDHEYTLVHLSSNQYITYSENNQLYVHSRKHT